MNGDKSPKTISALLFLTGFVLSWGGMLYASDIPDHFRMTGLLVALVGYGVFFAAVIIYEKIFK